MPPRSPLDIITFAWMTAEGDLPPRQRQVSWWDAERALLHRYVRNWADGLDRTLTTPHRKVVLTNQVEWFHDLCDRVTLLPIDARFKRITNKFIAYDPALPLQERMLLSDLDMVFIRPWDHLLDYPGDLIMNHSSGSRRGWRDWRPGGGFIYTNRRTSLYPAITAPLYADPEAVYRQCRCRERYWFARQIGPRRIDYWQRDYPGNIASYKHDIRRRNHPLTAAPVIWFHGEPRPHAVPEVAPWWPTAAVSIPPESS